MHYLQQVRTVFASAIFFLFLFTACKKTIDVVIPDNKVPYYEGVTTEQIQNYVTKAFIDVTGTEPEVAERDNWVTTLKSDGLDSAARAAFVNNLFLQSEFTVQFDNVFFAPMLGAYDTVAIGDQIDELVYFRSLAIANGDSAFSQIWAYEIGKLNLVLTASNQYHSGQITINEAKRRLADNYMYDQINMGTTNFVIACFENFLKRLPTDLEQSNSETMVNGQAARIFMLDGSTKGDFLRIMTLGANFHEGLVIDTYLHLLSRRPNSIEMGWNTEYLENGIINIKDMMRNIVISEEYVGF